MSETIWFKDLPGLITKDNFLQFFPTSDMTYVEQINSIVRFAIIGEKKTSEPSGR